MIPFNKKLSSALTEAEYWSILFSESDIALYKG